MRVGEEDLRPGDVVSLRRHTSGSLCLTIEKAGLEYTILRKDGSVLLFDSVGEAELYCRRRNIDLKNVRRKEKVLDLPAPSFERVTELDLKPGDTATVRRFSSPTDEELLPPLDPGWGEVIRGALVEAVRNQASKDLEGLVFLTEERERLSEELSLELIRREALGPKSCTCDRCIDRLSSPLREVQEKIDKIWSWWADSLGTTPAEVVAGRWS